MNDKKKILFILGVLDSGGVAKSLVSLVNAIDREKYDVSLLLVSKQRGPYYGLLPRDIHVIQSDLMAAVGSVKGLPYLLRHGHPVLLLGTLLRLFLACFCKAWSGYVLSRLMPAVEREYDLIVDYNGQHQTYYMVDKLKARKKAAFFHNDYSQWPYYYRTDKRYYPRLDTVFTISPVCVESLKRYFPRQADKIKLMENISSVKMIERMAQERVDLPRRAQWSLLTIGHVCRNKGTHLAIQAGRILKERGMDYTWYFVGNTAELPQFENLLDECGVRENFVFLGLKSNPYPYIRQCDIVVHPSFFEGKSVALDEVKILAKPVVVTNFTTVGDQFEDGVNASIVDMTPESIAGGIIQLMTDEEKRKSYADYLQAHQRDNTGEVEKIYKLLEGSWE